MTIELLRRSLEMIGRLRDDLNGMEDNESLELSLYSIDLENQISAALSQPASEDARPAPEGMAIFGWVIDGKYFVETPEEAKALKAKNFTLTTVYAPVAAAKESGK